MTRRGALAERHEVAINERAPRVLGVFSLRQNSPEFPSIALSTTKPATAELCARVMFYSDGEDLCGSI